MCAWESNGMKQGIKRKHLIIVLFLAISIILCHCYNRYKFLDSQSAEKLYHKYTNELHQIAEYLLTCSDKAIELSYNDSNTLFQKQYSSLPVITVTVKNSVVIENCETLKNAGMEVIYKEDTNVYFQFYSNLDDGSGILAVLTQTEPPIFDSAGIAVESEKIDGDWYYYRTVLHK